MWLPSVEIGSYVAQHSHLRHHCNPCTVPSVYTLHSCNHTCHRTIQMRVLTKLKTNPGKFHPSYYASCILCNAVTLISYLHSYPSHPPIFRGYALVTLQIPANQSYLTSSYPLLLPLSIQGWCHKFVSDRLQFSRFVFEEFHYTGMTILCCKMQGSIVVFIQSVN